MCHRWHTVNDIILYPQKSKWKNKNLPPVLSKQNNSEMMRKFLSCKKLSGQFFLFEKILCLWYINLTP